MPYRIAGIDVHKKMLAVVIADVAVDGEYQFDRRRVGTSPGDLRSLAAWLVARQSSLIAGVFRPWFEELKRLVPTSR